MAAEQDAETLEHLEEVLQEIAAAVGVEAEIRVRDGGDRLEAEFVGDELELLIGESGETLDAIQHLAYRIVYQGAPERRKPLAVDAAGYRAHRTAALHAAAEQAAQTASRERRRVELEPMGAQERKIVHEHLKERFDVETHSEGEEPARRIVVAPLVD